MSAVDDTTKAAITLGARHWRIWEWANGKLSRLLSSRGPFRPSSLRSLWNAVVRGEIRDGDYVELRGGVAADTQWYIQEWLPRNPGSMWLEDRLFDVPADRLAQAFHIRTVPPELVDLRCFDGDHFEHQFISRSTKKVTLNRQGFSYRMGIYRPPLGSDSDKYALLGLVSSTEYFIDLAFPVLVSNAVYRKIIEAQIENNALEIEGVLRISEAAMSEPFMAYIAAINAKRDLELKELLNTQIGIRSVYGHIVSPLDITVRAHNSHPIGTVRVEGHNVDPETRERLGIIFLARFLVTDPNTLPRELHQNDFLLGQDHQFGTTMMPVTDFDARLRRLASQAPVSVNPLNDPEIIEKFHYKSPFQGDV